jgi:hypothetical protein
MSGIVFGAYGLITECGISILGYGSSLLATCTSNILIIDILTTIQNHPFTSISLWVVDLPSCGRTFSSSVCII